MVTEHSNLKLVSAILQSCDRAVWLEMEPDCLAVDGAELFCLEMEPSCFILEMEPSCLAEDGDTFGWRWSRTVFSEDGAELFGWR